MSDRGQELSFADPLLVLFIHCHLFRIPDHLSFSRRQADGP